MIVIIIGFLNVATQVLLSVAIKLENATIIAPLHYLEVVFVLIVDLLFFEVKFLVIDIAGIILISICILIPLIRKSLLAQKNHENSHKLEENMSQSQKIELKS